MYYTFTNMYMLLYIAYIIFYNFTTIQGKFLGSHSVLAASSSAIIEFNFGKKWLLINMDRQAHITISTIQIEYAESKEKKRLAGSLYEKKTKYRKTTFTFHLLFVYCFILNLCLNINVYLHTICFIINIIKYIKTNKYIF